MCDVVVVGAGLSGLAAAADLERAGLQVTVLEAATRLGGKVSTVEVDGVPIDLGGHWVGSTQSEVMDLGKRLGLHLVRHPQPSLRRRDVFVDGSRRHRTLLGIPLGSPLGLLDLGQATLRLGWLTRRGVTPDWLSPSARADVLADRLLLTEFGRRSAETVLALTAGIQLAEVNAHELLGFLHSAGGIGELVGFAGSAQDSSYVEGAGALVAGLSASLTGDIRTGAAVTAVDDDGDRVRVVARDGVVDCRRVVMAVPFIQNNGVRFTPDLEANRSRLLAQAVMGRYTKTVVTYPAPWWRTRDLTGTAVINGGDVQMITDATPHTSRIGCLAVFSTGAGADRLAVRSPEERTHEVLSAIEVAFGPSPRKPNEVIETAWATEPFLHGAPSVLFGEKVDRSAIRRPHGRVHWAGGDLSDRWAGYMDGALRSGRRAASEIIDAMVPR